MVNVSSGCNQCARDQIQSNGEIKVDASEEIRKEKGKNSRPRRGRMRFTPEQIHTLEQHFEEQHYLLPADRKVIALALKMTERQVKTWFQNKRAQYKRTRPLIRNPIYHSVRPPYAGQVLPFLAGGIAHFSFSEFPNATNHTLSAPSNHLEILPITHTTSRPATCATYSPMLS